MTQTQVQAAKNSQKNNASSKFKPLGNRVLVHRIEAQETLKGGILLPETAKKKQEQAQVVAIGTGKTDKKGTLIPIPVKIGDRILMEKYSGQDVVLDGEEFVILRADDIIAIIEN